jgi:hypothetical protein
MSGRYGQFLAFKQYRKLIRHALSGKIEPITGSFCGTSGKVLNHKKHTPQPGMQKMQFRAWPVYVQWQT